MSTMHTSTPRDPQRCTAPRRLHRRLSGVFRSLHGHLWCALLVALVVGLAPAMMAPAAHADTVPPNDTANWMYYLSPDCAASLTSPTCKQAPADCVHNANPGPDCGPIDVPLNQLAIPGTHDTGTYSIPVNPPVCADNVFAPDFTGSFSDLDALDHYVNCPASIVISLAPLALIPGALAAAVVGILAGALAGVFIGIAPTSSDYVNALPILAQDALSSGVASAFTKFARSQDRDVTQMLDDGIRYFDLRVCGTNGNGPPRFCHSIYGEPIMTFVDDVQAWAAAHPRELVILDFNHFIAMSQYDEDALAGDIYTSLSKSNSLITVSDPQMTLRDVWQLGANVIVSYQNGVVYQAPDPSDVVGPFWPSVPIGSYFSDMLGANSFTANLWGNTYDVSTMDDDAKNALLTRCTLTTPDFPSPCPDQFFNYQLQLTPQTDDIVAGITSSDSLLAAAARSNPVVIPDFFQLANSSPLLQQSVSIVSADGYENSDLVQDVIALDKSR